MYKDGLFLGWDYYKKRKILPCGCRTRSSTTKSRPNKYTKEQFEILIKRELEIKYKNIEFKCFTKDYQG